MPNINFNDQSAVQLKGADRAIVASANALLSDNGAIINANSSSAIVITILQDSAMPASWGADSALLAYQAGAGAVSFAAGTGVTLNAGPSVPSAAQYGILGVLRVAANTWVTI